MPLAYRSLRFGPFWLDLRAAELHANGTKIKVPEQPFQVLSALLEHAGEVVTREELRQRLWPADTFVDFDHSLNAAVKRLREVLGDSAETPRFIETLPRHGYRFIAPVEEQGPEASPSRAVRPLFHQLTSRPVWVAFGVMLVVFLSGLAAWRVSRRPRNSLAAPVEVVPLGALPGYEAEPALSPEGNQVAFVGGEGKNWGIYTALVGGEKALRLTNHPGDRFPAWSPDGRQIAFYRYSDEGLAIYTIAPTGGTEHRVYKGPVNTWATEGVSWSPDGETLAFSENNQDKIHSRIALLSLGDFSTRPLTSPPDQYQDYAPIFSPDGSLLAFSRGNVAGTTGDIFVVPVAGGDPKQLTFDHTNRFGHAWTEDGREIVFSSWSQGGLTTLRRISASGGLSSPIAGVGLGAESPSISRKGNRLAYRELLVKDYIWRLDLKDEIHPRGPPQVVISEKGRKMRPHFSRDGSRITFESDRLGAWEIWSCDRKGVSCAQLTSLQRVAGAPKWSPDGLHIAFEFHPHEQSEIYLLDVASGQARFFPTNPGSDNLAPSWSRDGQWLYFGSRRGAGRLRFQVWKVPLKGGTPVQLTRNGGLYAVESTDRRFLYYMKYDVREMWRMPIRGGEETQVMVQPERIRWFDWALSDKGFYFISFRNHPQGTIEYFDFATRKLTPVWNLDKPADWGLALSDDGHSLLYVQSEMAESNIMVVKNFR